MTDNEKLVWAAAFAANYQENRDSERAAFAAWVAVAALRFGTAPGAEEAGAMLEEMRK